jgi:hypothetical protein
MDSGLDKRSATGPASGDAHRLRSFLPIREFDLREIVRIPWRQKQVIIGTVFVLTLLALVVLELLPPLYTATSTVTLNATQMNVVDIPAVLAGLRDDISLVPTEAAVIQSRDLAAKIIVQLNLDKNPEFNVALQPPTWLSSLNPMNLIPSDWLALMLGPPPVLTLLNDRCVLVGSGSDRGQWFTGGDHRLHLAKRAHVGANCQRLGRHVYRVAAAG